MLFLSTTTRSKTWQPWWFFSMWFEFMSFIIQTDSKGVKKLLSCLPAFFKPVFLNALTATSDTNTYWTDIVVWKKIIFNRTFIISNYLFGKVFKSKNLFLFLLGLPFSPVVNIRKTCLFLKEKIFILENYHFVAMLIIITFTRNYFT